LALIAHSDDAQCRRWNKKVNDGACAAVNPVKCNLKGSSKSKYGPCNEATCCTGQETVTVTVAPVPTSAPAKATVVSCAQYCGQNSLQCQVIVDGACALEGPFGQYNQCSKELCCRTPAPPQPQPQIVSCKQVVAGNGWSCGFVPDFGCAVGAPSGKYAACAYNLCCLQPIPPKPINPCANCSKYYCPPECNIDPVNPCDYCDGKYGCPDWCNASNGGYKPYY
jgi:hypothetical protein